MGINIYALRTKSITRIAAGRRAQKLGDRWQTLFHNSVMRQGFHCIRIHDGCKTAGRKLIRMPQAFDFIVSGSGCQALFVDTKAGYTKRFGASWRTDHQIRELSHLESHGHKSGYIVLFSTSSEVVFFSASKLKAMKPRESLGVEDGVILGTEMNFDLRKIFV